MIDIKKVILLFSVLSLILGCATLPPVKNPQITESNLPSQCRIEGIKPIKQHYMGCVPSCVEMVSKFYGRELNQDAIAKWIERARGTTAEDIEQFVNWNGFNGYRFHDWQSSKSKIKYFLSQGYPVIVGGRLGFGESGHTIVLIGFDDSKVIVWEGKQSKGVFIASDPTPGKIVQIGYDIFAEFHRGMAGSSQYYGLVVYPKN